MPVEGRIARTLQSATVWARSNFLSIPAQIDRTGLFPDLKGENGRQLRKSVTDEGAPYMLMCSYLRACELRARRAQGPRGQGKEPGRTVPGGGDLGKRFRGNAQRAIPPSSRHARRSGAPFSTASP